MPVIQRNASTSTKSIAYQNENPHKLPRDLFGKLSLALYDFDGRQRKNETYTLVQKRFFARKKLFLEMPWKHQIVIWFHRSRFFLADNGNLGAYRFCSVFFRISVRGAIDDRIVYTAPLQNRVSLG